MSFYADYLRERTTDDIIETDEGFATYRFVNAKTVYIVDIYVRPECRKSHVAKDLADEIVRRAKEKGCNELIGTVVPSTKNSTDSVKVLIAYGMSLNSSGNDLIVFRKEI